MILFIDSYDSFTFNLVQYFGEFTNDLKVVRNDELTVDEIIALNPTHVVLSPGPCTPNEAGICVELCQRLPKNIFLLGICLGHQSLGQAYNCEVVRGNFPIHGKSSLIKHTDNYLFKNIPAEFRVIRYHSLILKSETMSEELDVIARSDDGVIMGVRHKSKPHFGLQFHPESYHSEYGKEIIKNFISLRTYDS